MNNDNAVYAIDAEVMATRKTREVDLNLDADEAKEDKDTLVEPTETNKGVGINEIETTEVALDDDIEVVEKDNKEDSDAVIFVEERIVAIVTKVFDILVPDHDANDAY